MPTNLICGSPFPTIHSSLGIGTIQILRPYTLGSLPTNRCT